MAPILLHVRIIRGRLSKHQTKADPGPAPDPVHHEKGILCLNLLDRGIHFFPPGKGKMLSVRYNYFLNSVIRQFTCCRLRWSREQ